MASKWPEFVTRDLDVTSDEGAAEMQRRWEVYSRAMKALIAAGGVHQDSDGWWVDDATGELIGPDPEIERPRTDEELAQARPFVDAFPESAAAMKRSRGRPRVERPKEKVTLRLSADVLAKLRATGRGWQRRLDETLRREMGL